MKSESQLQEMNIMERIEYALKLLKSGKIKTVEEWLSIAHHGIYLK